MEPWSSALQADPLPSEPPAKPQNVQTTVRLCSFRMLAKLCSKSFKLGFSSTWTEIFHMYKLGFKEAEEPEIELPTFVGSWREQRSSRKNIYFCFVDYAKAFDSVDHNKLWKILKGMGVPDHLTCFLRNLYVDQEAAVRTRHGTTDWFQTWKGVWQGCKLSPCLFNLHADRIMQNAGLDESQARTKIARRNNNLRNADDTTSKAEIEQKLKNLLMRVKEEPGKSWLETQHSKT